MIFLTVKFLLIIGILTRFTAEAVVAKNCLQPAEDTSPKCQIIDNAQPLNPAGASSYECLDQWENTVYILKDGDITLDCTDSQPIDMDYDGVLPISNLNIEYYKKFEPTTASTGLDNVALSYRIRIRILAHRLSWSGRYVFYRAGGDKKNAVTISVFVERKTLPFFLPLKHTEDLDAYIDPTGKTLVIPCRAVNYASNVTLFYDYGPSDLSSDVLKYDPRIGFLITIDESEGVAYGLYECYTTWNAAEDRVKVQATSPDEVTEAPVDVTEHVVGHITYETLGNNDIKASCWRPGTNYTDFVGFRFVNLKARNPTHSRLGWNCFEAQHACEEGKQVGTPVQDGEIQVLGIQSLYYSGLLTCSGEIYLEAYEYFTGTDHRVYYDWNVAVANQALVKVTPAESYERYTIHGEYEFNCQFPSYIGVKPVWWGVKFQNGTVLESFEEKDFIKSFELDLDMVEIQCGITLWNATTWYKASLPITVTDFALPVIKNKNTVIRFENEAINQALVCEVESQPRSTIKWMKDGQKIEDIPVIGFQNSLILFFETVNTSHEGKYTCVATSASGDSQLDFYLSVGEKPDFGGALLPPSLIDGTEAEPGSSNDLIVINPIGDGGNASPNSKPTSSSPAMSLHRMQDDKEVDSTSSVVPGEILVVRMATPTCEANGGIVSGDECKLFVRVISTDASQVGPSSDDSSGRVLLPPGGSGTSSSNPNFNQDDGIGPLYPEPIDTRPMMTQLLAPLVVGFGSILLVIIIAYVTYTYYVMPWKVRRISGVSTVYTF